MIRKNKKTTRATLKRITRKAPKITKKNSVSSRDVVKIVKIIDTPEPKRKHKKGRTPSTMHKLLTPAVIEQFDRWKSGATMEDVSSKLKLGYHRVRYLFVLAAGGADKFKALRATGAGGAGTRGGSSGPRTRSAAPSDEARKVMDQRDKDLPRIRCCLPADGWTFEHRFDKRQNHYIVAVTPNGVPYSRARPNETADWIFDPGEDSGILPIRMRRYDGIAKKEQPNRERRELRELATISETRVKEKEAKRQAELEAKRTKPVAVETPAPVERVKLSKKSQREARERFTARAEKKAKAKKTKKRSARR